MYLFFTELSPFANHENDWFDISRHLVSLLSIFPFSALFPGKD